MPNQIPQKVVSRHACADNPTVTNLNPGFEYERVQNDSELEKRLRVSTMPSQPDPKSRYM
jgi:hypothetical protein